MTGPADAAPTTAGTEGPRWSARATGWAQLWAEMALPAWEAVADAAGIRTGTCVLDVGCGSGEFCQLVTARGAAVSGIDAAEGMIEIARRRVPGAELRVGAMERLPWQDDSFDLVAGSNAFQFAADLVAALAEARRVARPGGQVVICNRGRRKDCELYEVLDPLSELQRPVGQNDEARDRPAVGEPGVVEDLARRAGLAPMRSGESTCLSSRPITRRWNARCFLALAFCPRSSALPAPTAPTGSRTSSGT